MQRSRNVMLTAAGGTAFCAFLPWARFLGYSKSGISGDGIITLVAALVGLAALWRNRGSWIPQAGLGAMVLLVTLFDLNDAGNLAVIVA